MSSLSPQSSSPVLSVEGFAAAVAVAGGGVGLRGPAGGAGGAADAQVCAAGRAEGGTGDDDRAARPAASRQRRDVAARLARDVRLDDLPRVLGELVLPVGAERG